LLLPAQSPSVSSALHLATCALLSTARQLPPRPSGPLAAAAPSHQAAVRDAPPPIELPRRPTRLRCRCHMRRRCGAAAPAAAAAALGAPRVLDLALHWSGVE
jgi:hypothetical protein